MFPPPFDKLFNVISKYHEDHDQDMDKGMLWESIKTSYPTLTDAQRTEIYEVVQNVKEVEREWNHEFADKILTHAWKQEVFRQITEFGLKGSQGIIDTLEPLNDLIQAHNPHFIPKDKFQECNMDVFGLMEEDKNTRSWFLNIPSFGDKLGGMYGGQFLQLMARPDVGKTAFVVSLVASPGGFADQGAKIDWYVNEEPVKRTRWRCISAYTGKTKEELKSDPASASEHFARISDKVNTFDISFGLPVEFLAQRTKERKPDILIVDQLDKLGVTSITGGGFPGETERLRMLYIKFREIAKRTNCLVIGVCQASADAEGKTIVTYDQAENSKTGKAAECDVFLGIGAQPKTGYEQSLTRWLTVSKCKLDSGFKDTVACTLNPKLSRYEA